MTGSCSSRRRTRGSGRRFWQPSGKSGNFDNPNPNRGAHHEHDQQQHRPPRHLLVATLLLLLLQVLQQSGAASPGPARTHQRTTSSEALWTMVETSPLQSFIIKTCMNDGKFTGDYPYLCVIGNGSKCTMSHLLWVLLCDDGTYISRLPMFYLILLTVGFGYRVVRSFIQRQCLTASSCYLKSSLTIF